MTYTAEYTKFSDSIMSQTSHIAVREVFPTSTPRYQHRRNLARLHYHQTNNKIQTPKQTRIPYPQACRLLSPYGIKQRTRISNNYGCPLKFDNTSPNGDIIINVSGIRADEAIDALHVLCRTKRVFRKPRKKYETESVNVFWGSYDSVTTCQFRIPMSQMGLVIGRRGSTIATLRSYSKFVNVELDGNWGESGLIILTSSHPNAELLIKNVAVKIAKIANIQLTRLERRPTTLSYLTSHTV